MTRNAVHGALVHLAVFTGIPVIRSMNIQETAYLLIDILKQYKRKEILRKSNPIIKAPSKQFSKRQSQKLFVLQNLPGIGTQKALRLLNLFKTIENVVNASIPELMKVHGIGPKLAGNIFDILHESF